jgi:hypothetical protein
MNGIFALAQRYEAKEGFDKNDRMSGMFRKQHQGMRVADDDLLPFGFNSA